MTKTTAPPQHDERIADRPSSEAHERPLNVNRDGTPDDPQKTRLVEWLQLGANVALAVIGVVAICIYGGELSVMKGQLTELVKQYPELKKSANAAGLAAQVATRNAEDSERFFRLQNRPFVTISRLEQTTPLQVGDSLISLGSHNSGRTPALEMKISGSVFIGSKAIKFNSSHPSEAVVASDKETTNTYTLNLSETDVRMIMLGSELVFRATVRYTDIFKERHSTTICARYFPKEKNYKYCETGNEVE